MPRTRRGFDSLYPHKKILIIGSGGREHALAWKINKSPLVEKIFIAPGNVGTSLIGENIPLSKSEEILKWLSENPIDLVVVGPDDYLAEGIVDEIEKMNIPVFGPTKAASKIEWSKAFAKEFMKKENIPTASFEKFQESSKALLYLKSRKFPIVIKASGLALGKGVIISENLEEAEKAIKDIIDEKIFGTAGQEIIIEEYLNGKEISVHAFCDGEMAKLFPSAKDHKRAFEGNKGPNTGGMGTISPVPVVTVKDMKDIEDLIIKPTLKALGKGGTPFKGLLFPGIMLTEEGPKVIEFNARFGDPETQSYMRILESDIVPILISCTNGTLRNQNIEWSSKSAACIIAASGGYPGSYEKGKEIKGLENINNEDTVVFHAGTKLKENKIVTNGGRVLGVTSVGSNVGEALSKSYSILEQISFEGMQYRKDIGE